MRNVDEEQTLQQLPSILNPKDKKTRRTKRETESGLAILTTHYDDTLDDYHHL